MEERQRVALLKLPSAEGTKEGCIVPSILQEYVRKLHMCEWPRNGHGGVDPTGDRSIKGSLRHGYLN